MQKRLPHLVLLACLGAPSGSLAQEQSPPPDPTVEYRDRIETKKHEEINREREYAHEMELLKRKSSDCETDRSCAETDDAIQRSLVPGTAIMAVLHDIDVDDNALRVRIRFYNAGEELAVLAVDPSAAYEAFYVEAGGEKSFILRDEDGKEVARGENRTRRNGELVGGIPAIARRRCLIRRGDPAGTLRGGFRLQRVADRPWVGPARGRD